MGRNRPSLIQDRYQDIHPFRRGVYAGPDDEENIMLHYAIVFFIIALIAALVGFGGIAAGAAGIAKILFVVFLVMAIASFVVNAMRSR